MGLEHLLKPRLNELGKIKIGGKNPTPRTAGSGRTWYAPDKYDHFVITTGRREAAGAENYIVDSVLMESLAQHADPDGKLRQLPIALLSNNIDDVLHVRYEAYEGTRLAAHSDGVTLTKLYDRQSRTWLDQPQSLPWKPEFAELMNGNAKLFKLHAKFFCVLGASEARWGGVYVYRTTSVISANQLYSSLVQVSQLTGGVLRGLPLRLVVRPKVVRPKVNGRETQSTVHVVHVEAIGSDLHQFQAKALERARFELDARKEIAAIHRQQAQMLALSAHEDVTDAEHIRAEFFPEQDAPKTPPTEPDPLMAQLGHGPPTEAEIEELERKRGERT